MHTGFSKRPQGSAASKLRKTLPPHVIEDNVQRGGLFPVNLGANLTRHGCRTSPLSPKPSVSVSSRALLAVGPDRLRSVQYGMRPLEWLLTSLGQRLQWEQYALTELPNRVGLVGPIE